MMTFTSALKYVSSELTCTLAVQISTGIKSIQFGFIPRCFGAHKRRPLPEKEYFFSAVS